MARPTHAVADVAIVQEGHAVVGSQRLVDTFAVEESVIVDGDRGIFRAGDSTVDVDRTV